MKRKTITSAAGHGSDNKKSPAKRMSVYANLAQKRRTKKDKKSRKRAEYLATLPKHPVKRFFYRLHPKRVAKYWFSKHGALMALKILGVSVLAVLLLIGGLFAYFRKDLDRIRLGELAKRVQTIVTDSLIKELNFKIMKSVYLVFLRQRDPLSVYVCDRVSAKP